MTTKSPTSTCGANWGLCLPRSSCAVWLASRPSTTSVASMTCQARVTSPGFGVYVRTRSQPFVDIVGTAGGFASPSTGDGATRASTSRPARQQATIPAGRSRPTGAQVRRSAHLGQPAGVDVVDRAAHLTGQQVGALPDQPHG